MIFRLGWLKVSYLWSAKVALKTIPWLMEVEMDVTLGAVSYTHLTLPTKRIEIVEFAPELNSILSITYASASV